MTMLVWCCPPPPLCPGTVAAMVVKETTMKKMIVLVLGMEGVSGGDPVLRILARVTRVSLNQARVFLRRETPTAEQFV